MKKAILIIISITAVFSCAEENKDKSESDAFPVLEGRYFDQEPPDLKPKLFAPHIISTEMSEINAVYSPDYKEFYYSVNTPGDQLVIVKLMHDGIKWSEPEVASFSGIYADADPFITDDGKWLYYISKRPVEDTKEAKDDWDIWRVKNENGKWGEPQRLDTLINSPNDETYPVITRQERLYYSSGREGSVKGRDLYYAQIEGDGFQTPVRLDDNINSHWEGDAYVSADEDYIIFYSYGRPEGEGLFISFSENGTWSMPKFMGDDINIHGGEWCPILSPDGKYFFFTSNYRVEAKSGEKLTFKKIKELYQETFTSPQLGRSDIYWVDARIIDEFREKN